MAKKSHKKSVCPKKSNAGCMSGLISMFGFRKARYAQKLLSDGKCGNGKHGGTANQRNKVDMSVNLTKKPIDVSDISAKRIRKDNSHKDRIKTLMAEEISRAHTTDKIPSYKELDKNSEKITSGNYKVKSENHSNRHSVVSRSSWLDLMFDLRKENHIECNIVEKNNYILQKVLDNTTLKSSDPKEVTTTETFKAKEFMDALESLSNKDLFIKRLQDPNSVLFKKILNIQNAQTNEILNGYKSSEPHKQNGHHLFEEKIRLESSSHALNQIVVLKPSRKDEGMERVSSHFSLKEIKRKMINMIGESKKEQNMITKDSLLHKIPYGSPNSIEKNRTSTNTRPSTKLSTLLKRENDDVIMENSRYVVFYDEGKKRLADMLSIDDRIDKISSPSPVPKLLGRILSLPGYNSLSPIFSPRFSVQSSESSPSRNSKINSNLTRPNTQLDIEENSIAKDIQVEFNTDELGCRSERCDKEGSPKISASLAETHEIAEDNQDNCHSRLSVPKPFFSEDNDELTSEQTRLKHVRSVIEASGLNYNDISDKLLDPSVFDELEIIYEQLNNDSKIILDSINEVFIEICTRYSSFTPWVLLIKPNMRPTPTREILVQELCKGLDRYIHIVFPYTLDQIAKKDLEHEAWMNVSLEIEGVVIEIGEVILDYIMEETILEQWD